MLISCEKCSTTYVLDEALIPPQGAPVQCTRCGHVFTAKPGAEAPAPSPAPAPVAPWDRPELQNKASTSTLVFGASPASAAPAAAKPNQTMVFGSPAQVAASASAPAPTPAAAKPNQTMVFGSPASAAPAAPKANNQTMVFGAPPAGAPVAPAPAPAKGNVNQTMVFGTPAVNSGAAPAATAPRAANQTMVFGSAAPVAPPGPAAASPKQTMVFGSQPPVTTTPAQAAPKPNQTMVFGTPAATAAPPAKPAGPTPNPSQTLVFGSARTSATGLPTAGALPPPPASTAAAAPSKNQTMMFGRAPTKAPPKVTVGSAEPAGYAANASDEGTPLPTESTVRVELDAVLPPGEEESVQERHDRTQRYAMTEEGTTPPASSSVEERHNRTVLFAMNPMQDTTRPDAPAAAPVSASATTNETPAFGRDQVELTPPEARAAEAIAATLPNLPPIDPQMTPIALELPPEPQFFDTETSTATTEADAEAEMVALRAASNRRTTIAVVAFLVVALALAVTLLWFLFGRGLISKDSAELERKKQDALTALRRDDAEAKAEAVSLLKVLVAEHPHSVEARSALVMALAFVADDAHAEFERSKTKAEVLAARAAKSQPDERALLTANAEAVRTSMNAKSENANNAKRELTQALADLKREAHDRELNDTERFELTRADALTASVLGDSEAIALAEKCRQTGHGPDNWAELALPEYAANGGRSYDEALKILETIEQRDNTFLRAYVVAARIHLIEHKTEQADAQLSRVLSFHPGHDAAKSIQELTE